MKKKKKEKTLYVFLNYVKEYKSKIIALVIVFFIFNLGFIFTGYLNGLAIESIVKLQLGKAIAFLIIYFFVEVIGNIVINICYYFVAKLKIKISKKIEYDTYQKMMRLPAYAFEEITSGEMINRVTNDTENISDSIMQILRIVATLLCSVFILIYILLNSWIVGLEIFLFLFLYVFIVKYFTKRIKQCDKEWKEKRDTYTSLISESIRGVREIKTLGIIQNVSSSIVCIIKDLYVLSVKSNKMEIKYEIVSEILKSGLEVGTFITCAILVCHGQVSVTFFVAMTYYIYRYTWLVENITSFTTMYNRLMISLERISEILSNKLYADVEYGNISLEEIQGRIEFRNVSFSYKNEKLLLNDFSVAFEPNKKIAIVGPSGEGKTTLFNLITRLFEPVEGTIYLDGIPLSDLTEESLRKNIAIIRQEPFLFNQTILENFRLVEPNISIEEVRAYCKKAYIDEYIMSLKDNYNTLLGEGGVNLSGGQKQRLSIARALVKNAKVFLFDEATSALDNESQEYIKRQIDELAQEHTVLIVAHRLSTIMDADLIYVMQKGKMIACGKHQELMENCSFYKKLYNTEGSINPVI